MPGTPPPIVNIFCNEPRNLGDQMSRPSRWVPWLSTAATGDIQSFTLFRHALALRRSSVILGGGGLLGFWSFRPSLHYIVAIRPRTLILWGAGHNRHRHHAVSEPACLRKFDLVGLRDHGQGYEWVPCASCLSPAFDRAIGGRIEHDVVIYEHRSFSMGLDGLAVPRVTNTSLDLERALQHLASGAVVLTNSYHGAIWGTWLRRQVVVVRPFSSKFYATGYPLQIADPGEWRAAARRSLVQSDALDDARARNIAFGTKVRACLGL